MLDTARFFIGTGYNPYDNLALEEYFLETVDDKSCILYLWQNQNTVVIGRNQNAWKECRVEELESEDGRLARRLSGGGAVFHDLGNLNFTFLASRENYDLQKQLSVIEKAAKSLEIEAKATGRNDIEVDGRKISGNAFYDNGKNRYHHGTILVDVDMGKLSKYLQVSDDKLKSKGVSSVKSRVANLKEFCPDLTIQEMKKHLIKAFGQVYGLPPQEILGVHIDTAHVKALSERYQSWEWKYGRKIPFEYEISKRFDWGDIDIRLHIESGKVSDVEVFSDAMDSAAVAAIPGALKGCAFSRDALQGALREVLKGYLDTASMVMDIGDLLGKQNYPGRDGNA